MADILLYISWGLIALGSIFVVIGAIGIYRLPDVFTRLHATGVIDITGATFLFLGMALQSTSIIVTFKLFALFGLLFFTSPVATHALAQAALADGVKPVAETIGETSELHDAAMYDNKKNETKDGNLIDSPVSETNQASSDETGKP